MDNVLTSEALEQKIKDISDRFDKINEIVREKSNDIDRIRKEIIELQDEQKRLQGEYRFIINLAKEYGLLSDENAETDINNKVEENNVED
jgi:septal ring factor EnvC (AmiA/AmiB activator)